jgi:hypothetical protein
MARSAGGLFRVVPNQPFAIGCFVQIRSSARLPLSSKAGQIMDIQPDDPCGPYLVSFANGLKFRYHQTEIMPVNGQGITAFNPPITDPASTDPRPINRIEVS